MSNSIGFAGALGAALLWAFTLTQFQGVVRNHGAFPCNFFKSVAATAMFWLTLLALTLFSPWTRSPITSDIILLMVSGIAGMAFGDLALFIAIRHVGARQATILHSTSPIFLVGMTFLALDESLSTLELLGISLIVGGVLEVTRLQGRVVEVTKEATWRGVGWGLAAALGQAAGILLARDALQRCDFMSGATWRLTGAVIGQIVVLLVMGQFGRAIHVMTSAELWRCMILPTFLGTYCGIICMMLGITYAKAAVVGSLMALTPVFLVPFSVLLLGERFDTRILLGTIIAVVGVIVIGL